MELVTEAREVLLQAAARVKAKVRAREAKGRL